jgi:hypothetical protein
MALPEGDEQVRAPSPTTGSPCRAGSRPPCWPTPSRQAGNNLTQANIVNITNHFTNNTSGGLSTVTNWSTGPHHGHLSRPAVPSSRSRARSSCPSSARGAGLRLLQPEREEPGAGHRHRQAPRAHDPALAPVPGRSRRGSGAISGFRHPRHPLRLHLCHGGGGAGPHLPGHRCLQLRLRCPGLHVGLHLHPVGPERGLAHLGSPS